MPYCYFVLLHISNQSVIGRCRNMYYFIMSIKSSRCNNYNRLASRRGIYQDTIQVDRLVYLPSRRHHSGIEAVSNKPQESHRFFCQRQLTTDMVSMAIFPSIRGEKGRMVVVEIVIVASVFIEVEEGRFAIQYNRRQRSG